MYCEIDNAAAAVTLDDLNAGGVFVQTTTSPLLDSEVDVFLQLRDVAFHARGHVVQVVSKERGIAEGRRPGFGLLFTNVGDPERAELKRAIEQAHAEVLAATRPPEEDPVERDVLAKLGAELRALANKAPWQVLGVAQDCDAETLKQAFFQASKRYHPHQYAKYRHPKINPIVTELFIAHKRAYTSLTKALAKSDPTAQSPPAKAEPLVVKSDRPARGTPPLGMQRPFRSEDPVRTTPASGTQRPSRSDEPRPRAVEIELLIQGAIKHLAQNRFDEAELDLHRAVALDQEAPKTRIWLLVTQARRAKAANDLQTMCDRYGEALQLDPKHHEALSETKKYAKDGGSKPGLLGRLFGSGNK
ncbi:MAG TPA: PilZ domain-containing protein [Polyangiales bacterium]|nr:PilZ domain-containing protein [Polyangiales bacterium]